MPRRSTALTIFAALASVPVLQALYYYPRLPGTVASHFGAGGQPDSWMEKRAFIITSLVVTEGAILFCALLAFAMPLLIQLLPASAQIDPDRMRIAHEVRKRIRSALASFGFWFTIATGVLVIVVTHFVFVANLRDPVQLPPMLPVLGVHLAVVTLLAIRLVATGYRLNREFPAEPPPEDVWFPAKRYGWGWGPPVRWQGWVVMLAWLAAFAAGTALLIRWNMLVLLFLFTPLMAGLLIAVCWAKGEQPRWRWGE